MSQFRIDPGVTPKCSRKAWAKAAGAISTPQGAYAGLVPVERSLRVEQRIAAPVDRAWARLSDHEGTPSWIEQVKRVRIVEAGTNERGGLGAVREVVFKPLLWSTILERITVFEPPSRFSYVLFSGMPGLLDHEGRVSVTPLDASTCVVRWEVDFRFRSFHWFRAFLPGFLRDFEGVLGGGLRRLKDQLESPSP